MSVSSSVRSQRTARFPHSGRRGAQVLSSAHATESRSSPVVRPRTRGSHGSDQLILRRVCPQRSTPVSAECNSDSQSHEVVSFSSSVRSQRTARFPPSGRRGAQVLSSIVATKSRSSPVVRPRTRGSHGPDQLILRRVCPKRSTPGLTSCCY